jgi:hypothetical protein
MTSGAQNISAWADPRLRGSDDISNGGRKVTEVRR